MNKELIKAEHFILETLKKYDRLSMIEIIQYAGNSIKEEELRAAVWTLRSEGEIEFSGMKVILKNKRNRV